MQYSSRTVIIITVRELYCIQRAYVNLTTLCVVNDGLDCVRWIEASVGWVGSKNYRLGWLGF